MQHIKLRLTVMNFLQFAVWGAYLTSMGSYLGAAGFGSHIGIFYAMQGIVSLFMPALIGIIADRWIPAQKMLGICHVISAMAMVALSYYGFTGGINEHFSMFFLLYSVAVAFYMPTLALSNSVAFSVLEKARLDTVKYFPPIRVFGTIGFIVAMWITDLMGLQQTPGQFIASAVIGLMLAGYTLTLPSCPVSPKSEKKSFVEMFGLKAFSLFKERRMAIFFIFSMLLGVSLQITNGFANLFITSFGELSQYADTFGAQHANMLISFSQMSEAACILLIPFFLRRFGIKKVMFIAMMAWVLRFGLFGAGDPGPGVWMFILSMLVYGVAFDFFNVSGGLFVNHEVGANIRSSAQGLFMMMTNGFGATIGTLAAQVVVNKYVYSQADTISRMQGWSMAWYIFAGYALVVAILFLIVFKYKHDSKQVQRANH